jgi:hypothetical protein
VIQVPQVPQEQQELQELQVPQEQQEQLVILGLKVILELKVKQAELDLLALLDPPCLFKIQIILHN